MRQKLQLPLSTGLLSRKTTTTGMFDLITFVASLHHLDSRAALTKARSLTKPSGTIIVVGLTAERSLGDKTINMLRAPVARLSGLFHHETKDSGVQAMAPSETLRTVRDIAADVLPGFRLRYGLLLPLPSEVVQSARLISHARHRGTVGNFCCQCLLVDVQFDHPQTANARLHLIFYRSVAIHIIVSRYAIDHHGLGVSGTYWSICMSEIRLDAGLVAAVRAGCDKATAAVPMPGSGNGGIAGGVISQWSIRTNDLGARVREIPSGVAAVSASFQAADESVATPFRHYVVGAGAA